MQKHNFGIKIACILLAILTVIAFTTTYKVVSVEKYVGLMEISNESINQYGSSTFYNAFLAQMRYMMAGWGFQNSVLTIFIAIVYYKLFHDEQRQYSIWSSVLATIFAVCFMVGKCYQDAGTISFMINSWKYFFLFIIFFIGVFSFFYCCIEYMYICVKKANCSVTKNNNKLIDLFENRPFIVSTVVMLLSRIAYLLFFWPGIVNWDAMFQLDSFYGIYEWTTHHPPFSTLVMVLFYNIGKFVGGTDNWGVFFYSVFQLSIEIMVVSYSISLLKRWRVPIKARIILLLYFALFTVWGIYSVTMVKDSMYYICLLLWYVLFLKIYYKEKKISIAEILILTSCSIVVILMRKNGVYVIVPTLIIAGVRRIDWRRYMGTAIAIFLCSIFFENMFWPVLGVADNTHRDEFSMLFQQTARYIKEYPDDVTDEERKILEEILVYDKLAERYNPDIADPVKASAGTKVPKLTDKEKTAYLHVWFEQLKRHPIVYIEAFLNGTYRYWYPNAKAYNHSIGQYFHTTDSVVDKGLFEFSFIGEFSDMRTAIYNLSYILYKMPVINLLYCPATYTWVLLFVLYFIMREKKYTFLISAVPICLALLINMISPVNGSLRYMLPIMAMLPILLLFIVFREKE